LFEVAGRPSNNLVRASRADPVHTVVVIVTRWDLGQMLEESLIIHGGVRRRAARDQQDIVARSVGEVIFDV